MLIIRPFRGIIYDEKKVGDLTKVLAPPYDVISPSEQKFYHQLHPYNIIRIILGEEYPADTEEENRYTRARNYFKKWLSSGILVKEKVPAIYVYEQEYHFEERRIRRRGFIVLMRLEKFGSGVIFPHERTLPHARLDRLRLLRACRANFSPIFSLYSDCSHRVDERIEKASSLFSIRDKDGVKHSLGAIRDRKVIEEIAEEMKDKKVFIADGHHRYLTALSFREEMGGGGGEDFVMMYFLNMEGGSATILPVHRVVRNLGVRELAQLKKNLSEFFNIEAFEFSSKNEEQQRKRMLERVRGTGEDCAFGMYCGERRYYLLSLKENYKDSFQGKVDSAILNELILEKILKKKDWKKGEDIDFVKEEKKAVSLIRKGNYQVAFFLKPPSLRQIREISLAGKVMPPKTSYFYPKLLSGLVIRELDEQNRVL